MNNESIFKGVVEDELERNLRKQVVFKNEYNSIPKGSLVVVTVHGDKYIYRKYRNRNKVISEYIGPIESTKAKEAVEMRNKMLKLKQDIKELKNEEKDLRRFLKLYD